MASPPQPAFPLKPWPTDADRRPKSLAEFIARVNAQHAGFRNVTESGLCAEVAESEAIDSQPARGIHPAVDVDMAETSEEGEDDDEDDEDDEDDDEEEQQGDSQFKDAPMAKDFMLRTLDAARNTAAITLDLVSLLLSKETPGPATQTLSPMLRELVGIGTIGAGRISLPSDAADPAGYYYRTGPAPAMHAHNPARALDDDAVATGWSLMDIASSRASASAASAFLAAEVRRESRYWSDVLRVRDAGWGVCRIASEKTLGVRFGFHEAAPEFRASSLAPLRRGGPSTRGAAVLDTGRHGAGSERLVVTVERDGRVTGRSAPAGAPPPDDAPIEARVLEARNTILAQELWHELQLEARGLHVNGVQTEGSRLSCQLEEGVKVFIELVTAGADQDEEGPAGHGMPDQDMASLVRLGLHVLLSHAHADNEMRRLRPSPPHQTRTQVGPVGPAGAAGAAGVADQQAYLLIRPIMQHMGHREYTAALVAFLGDLVGTLRRAGVPDASFKLLSPVPATPDFPAASPAAPGTGHHARAPHSLLAQLLTTRQLHIHLVITPQSRLDIRVRTDLNPLETLVWVAATMRPETETQTGTRTKAEPEAANPLAYCCPPSREPYPTLRGLFSYLRLAAERALADHFLRALYIPSHPASDAKAEAAAAPASVVDSKLDPEGSQPLWAKDASGSILCQGGIPDSREIIFQIVGPEEANEEDGTDEPDDPTQAALVVTCRWREKDEAKRMRWRWAARGESFCHPLEVVMFSASRVNVAP